MCQCRPEVRTPYCGRMGCNPPREKASPPPKEPKVIPLVISPSMTVDSTILCSIEAKPEGEWFFLTARVKREGQHVFVDGLLLTETPK